MSPTITLFEPQIPQNTGTIARLCAANYIPLHIVGPIGFSLDDKHLKRAGLDYWPEVNWAQFQSTRDYLKKTDTARCFFVTTKSHQP